MCGSLCKAFSLLMRSEILFDNGNLRDTWLGYGVHLLLYCNISQVNSSYFSLPSCRFDMRFFLTNVLRWLTKVREKGARCIATLLTMKLFCTQNVVNMITLMRCRQSFSVFEELTFLFKDFLHIDAGVSFWQFSIGWVQNCTHKEKACPHSCPRSDVILFGM